jgi:DNA-binding MarR family transcriptional regulator
MHAKDIENIRAFNRFYTKILGLLDKHLLGSQFTLPEVRVMYEIYQHKKIGSKQIADLLGMDKGYLSRMLLSFEKQDLIERKADKKDGRAQEISLTAKGKKEFINLNNLSENQIAALLSTLSAPEIKALVDHMDGIKTILQKINQ